MSSKRFVPYALTIIFSLFGIVTVFGLNNFFEDHAQRALTGQFNESLEEITYTIENGFGSFGSVLTAYKGFFEASNHVSREEWRIFYDTVNVEEFVGLSDMAFAQFVTNTQMASHVQNVQAEGFPNYQIKPAPGSRTTYMPILYSKRADTEEDIQFGFDIYSDFVRRSSVEKARDNNQIVLTKKNQISLVDGGKESTGFLLYIPIYKKGANIDLVEERREAFEGVVTGLLDIDRFMTSLAQVSGNNILIEVYEGRVQLPVPDLLIYKEISHQQLEVLKEEYLYVPVPGGQYWTVRVQRTIPASEGIAGFVLDHIIVVFGLTLVLLLTISVLVVLSKRHQLEEKTETLENQLMAILDASDYSIVTTDIQGIIRRYNKASLTMLGYSAKEVIGEKHIMDLFDGEEISEYVAKQTGRRPSGNKETYDMIMRMLMDQGAAAHMTLTYIGRSGQKMPVEVVISPLYDADGRAYGALSIAHDVSKEKQREQELTKRNAELERLNALMVEREIKMVELKKGKDTESL